ncbi:MAG: hypothetical protein ABR577_11040 [Pyrinomonadaceae bacterium]
MENNEAHAMSEKRFNIPVSGILLITGFAAYYNIAHAFFLSDDFDQIGKVRAGDLSVVWGREHGGFFRPLFILSYWMDVKLWNANPLGFHLTNIAFHTANAFLLFILTRRLIARFDSTPRLTRDVSLAAALIFLLLPSHTEAVSWISGRADLLAAFFSLASLIAYVSYLRANRLSRIVFALLFFALALLSKEAAICLPFVMLIIGGASAFQESSAAIFKRTLKIVSVFALALFAFICLRYLALGSLVGGYGASQHLNFSPAWMRDRLIQATLRAVLPPLPLQLSAVLLKPLKSPAFLLFAVLCAGLIAALIVHRHRRQDAAARKPQNIFTAQLIASFLCCLLPVINLRLGLYDTQGERFLYLPSVFSSIATAYIAFIFLRRRSAWLSLMGCLLIFYSFVLYRSNENWRQAAKISQAIVVDIAASSGHNNLLILNAPDNLKGAPVFHNGLEAALKDFQPAKQLKEIRLIALHNLQSANDEIELTGDETELNEHPRSFTLRLRNEACAFERVDDQSSCVAIRNRAKTFFQFQTGDCLSDTDTFVFDRGRMLKVMTSQ